MNIRKIISSHKSWQELNQTLESYTKSNQAKLAGDIFELVVKLYLQVSPVYKTKLKKVYLLKEIPAALKTKLNIPNEDEGIDIIAETFDKEFYAIQCKYRSNPEDTLTIKGDLSTFTNLAFNYCKHISHGIVCATTNRPPKKVKLLKSVGFETIDTWLSLDDNNKELWNLIVAKAIGKIVKPELFKPKPHQVKAIANSINYFKSNDRGKMIMPCGTGKSLTAFWIAEKLNVKSVIVAVPSLALLQQTLKVWTREYLLRGYDPDWICVCSDDTVKEEQDDFVSFTYDLGIHVTTDAAEIKTFIKKKTNKIKIVFTTYQSGKVTAQGAKGFKFDLGIMDEAHKTVGLGSKAMAHLIYEKNIKIKRRLFMTATERLFRGDKDEFLSMDDPRDYGKIIYELSFKDAINAKPPIISDYKIITFGISNPDIEEIYQSNKYLQVKKDLNDITARELATALALRKAIKKLNIKNAISFHRSIRRAENFKKQQELISKVYPEYGSLKTFNVRGDMPASERANQMRLFAEGKGLMTNARCLTEGVDLPAIDCVCFTDPKRSKVDIVQAAGRALRLAKGKKFGYILIPIFIPDENKFNELAEEQGFDDVAITVRALATSDKRIVEYLRGVASGRKPKGGSPVDGLTKINVLEKIDADEFNQAVQLKVWDKVAVGNYRSYEEAKKYAQSLKLKNSDEWKELKRKKQIPKDIPHTPDGVYVEWKNWGEFLGTGNISYRGLRDATYEEAKKYARNLKLKNAIEWFKHTKSKNFPKNIPIMVNRYKEFEGFGEFLGSGNKSYIGRNKEKYLNYEKTKKLALKLKLKSREDWFKYFKNNKKPENIILYPDQKFKEFEGWGVFLGTGNVKSQDIVFLDYETAKKKLKKFKFNSQNEFRRAAFNNKIPKGVPKAPHIVYSKKFKGYDDFLSNPYAKRISYRSYQLTKKFAQSLRLKQASEWKKLILDKKLPVDIPRAPQNVYKGLLSFCYLFCVNTD
jgi:superfamily II DNA or RNA helicase